MELYVAVMLSPFLIPVIVPVKAGLGSPYKRFASAGVTESGAGLIVNLAGVFVTLWLPNLPSGSFRVGAAAVVVYVAVMLSAFLIPVMVPVKEGLGSPYSRPASAAVTVSGAGLIVSLAGVFVTL